MESEKDLNKKQKAKQKRENTLKMLPQEDLDPVSDPYDVSFLKPTDLLPREFYKQDVVTLSQELLGKVLVSQTDQGIIKCMIVETEAYKAPLDKACHAYSNKKTDRTKYFWQDGGFTYMYSIYGRNYCFNVVAKDKDSPEAVLVRSVEPLEGEDLIRQNREISSKKLRDMVAGPAKFTKAMKIDINFNGVDLTKKTGKLWIEKGKDHKFEIERSKRINIGYSEEWEKLPWRFTIKQNEFISVKQ